MNYENSQWLNEQRVNEECAVVKTVNSLIDSLREIASIATTKIDMDADIKGVYLFNITCMAWPLVSVQRKNLEYCLALLCDGRIVVLKRTIYDKDCSGIYGYYHDAALAHVKKIENANIPMDFGIEFVLVHRQLLSIAKIFGIPEEIINSWKQQYLETQTAVDEFVSGF